MYANSKVVYRAMIRVGCRVNSMGVYRAMIRVGCTLTVRLYIEL